MLNKLADFKAKNKIAAAPKSTNKPTHTSILERCIASSIHQILNIMAVRMKSSPNTANEATTTVLVVARETPSGVGCAS